MSIFGSIFGVDGLKKDVKFWLQIVASLFVVDILTRMFIPCGVFSWLN